MNRYKNYIQNPDFFNKNGRRRAGVYVEKARLEIERENPSEKDTANRAEVVNEIGRFIKEEGMTLEEACRIVAKNDITNEFNYIFGAGRSEEQIEKIAKTYAGWYNGRVRQKREIEKGFQL